MGSFNRSRAESSGWSRRGAVMEQPGRPATTNRASERKSKMFTKRIAKNGKIVWKVTANGKTRYFVYNDYPHIIPYAAIVWKDKANAGW
jgi:hypothetical protein